ncbi:MAG: adenylate kinase, partial [Candidatus Diapherotrites archaeon]
MNLILLGAPGVGKGTVAQFIEKELGFKQVSTGDLLRKEVSEGTELGMKAKGFMEKGALVPDELVAEIIVNGLKGNGKGIVLDGFPRNLKQAELLEKIRLEKGIEIDLVIDFVCDEEILINRITSRRSCGKCKEIYGAMKMPKQEGLCDSCESQLIQRPDDKEEVVRERFRVYNENNAGLPEFYREKDLLVEVDGSPPIPEVTAEVKKIIKEKNN